MPHPSNLVPILLALTSPLMAATTPTTNSSTAELYHAAVINAAKRYDPAEKMLTVMRGSEYAYHSALRNVTAHETRGSMMYGVACILTGDPALKQRGEDVIRRVCALQDTDPKSKTYGIWSYYLEEPLAVMKPPDWNWADFIGSALLQIALHHRNDVSPETLAAVDTALNHAARSVQRRDVAVSYTNIAVMGTYVTLCTAEQYSLPDLRDYAIARLHRFYDYTKTQGGFTEYNSPTYTIVALNNLGLLRRDMQDAALRPLVDELYRMVWQDIADHFHPPTHQWAGPHSRAYRNFLDDNTLAVLQRGTNNHLDVGQANHPLDLASYQVDLPCPPDLYPLFIQLDTPRLIIKTWTKDPQPLTGTTYLTPQLALGSINRGNFWNQCRPIIAYFGNPQNLGYLQVRLLHDGYDFSPGQVFTAQDKLTFLSAVNFATDTGDKHINIDKLKDATFRAKDLRLRFEFVGRPCGDPLALPASLTDSATVDLGAVSVAISAPYARFGNLAGRWETATDNTSTPPTASLDIVLYSGPERSFNLAETNPAALAFGMTFSIDGGRALPPAIKITEPPGQLRVESAGLHVSIPTAAAPAATQRAAVRFD